MKTLAVIWDYRYFWLSLVKMDLRQRYRRSALGVGWSLLHPIAMTVVFCLIFSSWFEQAEWWRTAPFFLAGLAIWDFIRSSITQGCHSFFTAESYIRQCPLPVAIYPLRTVLGASFHFLIAIGVFILAVTVLHESWKALIALWSVIPAILIMMIFCWSLAVIGAFVNVFFQDTQHILDVLLQVSFFLQPIMYEKKMLYERGLHVIADYNPIMCFYDLVRAPLLSGEVPELSLYATACGVTAITLTIALCLLRWLEKKLIFQL